MPSSETPTPPWALAVQCPNPKCLQFVEQRADGSLAPHWRYADGSGSPSHLPHELEQCEGPTMTEQKMHVCSVPGCPANGKFAREDGRVSGLAESNAHQRAQNRIIGSLLVSEGQMFGKRVELAWPDGMPDGMTEESLRDLGRRMLDQA